MNENEATGAAREDFGGAKLGDPRRTVRLASMAARAYCRPAGRILQVFETSAERQGAYDFLGNAACSPAAITDALGVSTARRCREHTDVFVSIDGSSLTLVDHTGKKGFGGVGATKQGGRGLKVVTALAVDAEGTPIGVLDQQWWARPSRKKRHDCHARTIEEKETRHWLECAHACKRRLTEHAPGTRIWFLLDRESDRRHSLEDLRDSCETYVVRSSYNRRLEAEDKRYLFDELRAAGPLHEYLLDVPGGPKRTARKARMVVRTTRVAIRLRDRRKDTTQPFEVTVVETREEGTTPSGETPIAWRLLTNYDVATAEDADRVIDAYATRWSIESFHKTWKTGACNVEDSQLRGRDAMVKWGHHHGRLRCAYRTSQDPQPQQADVAGGPGAEQVRARRPHRAQAKEQETNGNHPRLDPHARPGHLLARRARRLHRQIFRWTARLDHHSARPRLHRPRRSPPRELREHRELEMNGQHKGRGGAIVDLSSPLPSWD